MSTRYVEKNKWSFPMQILVFLIIATLFPAEGMATMIPALYALFGIYGKYIAFLLVLLLAIIRSKKGSSDKKVDYLFVILSIYIIIITVLKGAYISEWINVYGNAIFVLTLISWAKNRLPELLKIINVYLIMVIFINFICLLVWPSGMYISKNTGYTLNWFLGYKSSFQYYLFPCVVISWLEYEYKVLSGWLFLCILGLCLYESIISGNIMLVIAVLLIVLVSVFKFTKLTFIFNPRFYFLLILTANIAILYFNTNLMNSGVGLALLLYFNKGTTLGGRISLIWPISFKTISESPIFGHGLSSAEANRLLYHNNVAIHAHNQFLEFAVTGGIVMLVAVLLWLYKKFKNLYIHRELASSRVIGFSSFVIFLMVTVEVFTRSIGSGFWLILFLSNYAFDLDLQYRAKSMKVLHFKLQHGKIILSNT